MHVAPGLNPSIHQEGREKGPAAAKDRLSPAILYYSPLLLLLLLLLLPPPYCVERGGSGGEWGDGCKRKSSEGTHTTPHHTK